MNVYQKLAEARKKLKDVGLKQSGKNKGVGYTYFDLSDILPHTTKIEQELGLISIVSFTETEGTLTVYNSEQSGESIVFKSPMKGAELKGCHPVQNLGAAETYVRRYLYLLAYEIVESDAVDGSEAPDKASGDKASQQKPSERKAAPKTKYGIIKDILEGSEFTLENVTEYILKTFGSEIKINELTDEQFQKVVMTLRRNIGQEN